MEQLSNHISFHIFSDNTDIEVNPKSIAVLLEAFSEFGLIPNIGQQVNALTGEKKKIIRMVSENGDSFIEFLPNRIIISLTKQDDIELTQFKKDAMKMLNNLQKIDFTKKASRLSVITNKTFKLASLNESRDIFDKVFSKEPEDLIEWEFRKAIRSDVLGQKVNNVLRVHSGEGMNPEENNGKFFNFLSVEVDTNTLSENTGFLFPVEDSEKYFDGLIEKNNALSQSLSILGESL